MVADRFVPIPDGAGSLGRCIVKDLREFIGQYMYVRQGPRMSVRVQGEVAFVTDEEVMIWDRGAIVRVSVSSVYAINVDTLYVE